MGDVFVTEKVTISAPAAPDADGRRVSFLRSESKGGREGFYVVICSTRFVEWRLVFPSPACMLVDGGLKYLPSTAPRTGPSVGSEVVIILVRGA